MSQRSDIDVGRLGTRENRHHAFSFWLAMNRSDSSRQMENAEQLASPKAQAAGFLCRIGDSSGLIGFRRIWTLPLWGFADLKDAS